MYNEPPLALFQPLGQHLLHPRYGDYSFGAITPTIEAILTGERHSGLLPADCFGDVYPAPRKVVFIVIDSFGWEFWRAAAERHGTVRRIGEQGVVTPVSALFPSTTSASITTMNTGVLPARHALVEWNLYIEAYGQVIQTLPFTPLGHNQPSLDQSHGADPRLLLDYHETIHQRLTGKGVASLTFAHQRFAYSAYNRVATAGTTIIPHGTLAQALVDLRHRLETTDGPALLSFYWPDIDAIAHHYGPNGQHHLAEIANFWRTFEAIFPPGYHWPETLFLFTADHGQVRANPAETVQLNLALPQLAQALRRTASGDLVRPTGSPRDVFLHLQPGTAEQVAADLRRLLAGRAEIMTTDEALALGLFGPPPYGAEFRKRIGDLLILPHGGHYVWWHEPDLMENRFWGHHGGLSAAELITVFAATSRL